MSDSPSSNMELFVLIVSILFLAYCFWKYTIFSENLPPGPVGIPFLGYIPLMGKTQHLTFSELKAKYGDIFSFHVGRKLFVVLSSYTLVREALIKQGNNFAARPVIVSGLPPEFMETKGIALNTGELFNEFKQVALSVFKMITRSDGNGESIITSEIQYLLRDIDQHDGKPTDIRKLISFSVASITSYCVLGERGDKNDNKFKAMIENMDKRAEAVQVAGIELAFPQIFYIPLFKKIFQASTAIDCYKNMDKYLNDKINAIEISGKPKDEVSFLHEWFKLHPKRSADYNFYRKQLTPVLSDLFSAGKETTVKSLQWAILYMMQYPDIQKKVQAEINDVIGKLNKPSMVYKNKMPFTEATLAEIHRITSIVPFSLPHTNTETTTVSGYTIPENSVIIPNIWEIHHNPEKFPNPEAFRPERFLENEKFKKIDDLIPFSVGKRQCIGEAFARMEFFLIFTSLLQRYTFQKPKGVQLDFTYDFSFVVSPRPYQVIAIPN